MTPNLPLFKPKYRVQECLSEIEECLNIGWTGLGYKTVRFEQEWQQYTGHKYAHFLNSSTSGLYLTLEIFKEIFDWPNDAEVVTSPLTFVSTNHSILRAGLTPVFCDVDESLNLNPDHLSTLITSKTVCIIFVGIGGNPDNYQSCRELASNNNLCFVFDAAHMAGCFVDEQHIGLDADATIYSFQAVKNLPTADSGMICFNKQEYDNEARERSWLGIDKDTYTRTAADSRYKWEYDVKSLGSKYHGNSIMASLGIVALRYLNEDNQRRRLFASLYNELLTDIPGLTCIHHCVKTENGLSSRHLYQVRVHSQIRNFVMSDLNEHGIYPGVHYKHNLNHSIYSSYPDKCINSKKFSDELISLPMALDMTADDIKYICSTLIESVLSRSKSPL